MKDIIRLPLPFTVLVLFMGFLIFPVMGCLNPYTQVQFRYAKEDVVAKADRLVMTGKIYRDWDTILIGDLLWYSADLKKAYLLEMKEAGRVDDEDFVRKMEEIEENDAKEIEFLAAIYTSEKKWDDFDNRLSIWKFRLKGRAGRMVAPGSIRKLKEENIPDSHLFFFITPWKTIYRITFPRNEEVAGMPTYRVELYSILGDTAFVWRVEEEERAKKAYGEPVEPEEQEESD